jgi:diguanylate cyclase (GGDEF)-like protein
MINREQQQARLFAEAMGANGRAGRDLAWIVATTSVLVFAAVATGWIAAFLDWADGLEGSHLDGMVALLVLVPLGSGLYALRRYRDADAARRKLHELSYHDSLTGLPNRRLLADTFDDLLRTVRRVNGKVAVLFIDLGGFKKVNDSYGHEAGDQLLVAAAERLALVLGPTDRMMRYGGDEFVALCPEVTTAVSAQRIATKLLKALDKPFELIGDPIHISASVGIALTEDRCTRPDEVLRDADTAMYQARQLGSGRYVTFDRSASDQITPSVAERRLRLALDNGEFRLYYQPIVSLWTRRLVGVEGLLRWNDPRRGMIAPSEFLPALDETGLIVPVGDWIFKEICAQSRRWQDSHPGRAALNIKVKVSSRQLAQANLVQSVRDCLSAGNADPDRISLEMTEGALIHDLQSAESTLREAKAAGLSLGLDHFGTGYSSLSSLRRFGLDLLKIDRSFIEGLGHSAEDATIVAHMIRMAKALGIVTAADGVETEDQVKQLRAMSCDLAQGDFFSPPQPPDVIGRLMGANAGPDEWQPGTRTRPADADAEADGGDAGAPAVADSASVVDLDRSPVHFAVHVP